MDKWMEISLIIALALSIACIMMLAGCTASDSGQAVAGNAGGIAQDDRGNGAVWGNRSGMMQNGSRQPGMRGNITDAQRQQMMQEGAAACDGKSEGDACAVQNAFGGAQGGMNGTCLGRDGNLTCMPPGAGGQQGRRAWPPQNPENTG
jgi:hypothetical protein